MKGNNIDQNHASIKKIDRLQSRAGCDRRPDKQKGVNFFTPFLTIISPTLRLICHDTV